MATTHVTRCFYCASIITYEARSECIDFFYIFLHVHRTRAHPVLVHHAFGVEVGESHTFMYVRQHGPVVHQKSTVLSTSAPPIVPGTCPRRSRFGDCSSLWCCTCRWLRSNSTSSCPTPRTVSGPLHLEHTRCPLVVHFARNAARLGAGPQATGESTAHVFSLTIDATFGREPFGVVQTVMLSHFLGHECIDGITG